MSVTATRHTSTVETGAIDLGIQDGVVELSATTAGDLVIDRFEVSVDDVVLSETELPPSGITLTGISLRLAGSALAHATWYAEGNVAAAGVTVDLDLDWAIENEDGEPLPLGIQRISGVEVELDVASDAEGRVVLTLRAARAGEFWDWAGIVQLSDLTFSLTSRE